jgi:cytochrome c556
MQTKLMMGIAVAALTVTMTAGVFIGEAIAAQPHMEAALSALQTARGELMEASHNKAGHRAEALRLTNAAIAETQQGMADAY